MITFKGVVYPLQCDVQGHLNVKEYVGFFDQAEWHCFLELGFDPSDIRRRRIGWADVKHTIEYRRELLAGALIRIESSVVRVGTKSLTSKHLLYDAGNGDVCAVLDATTVQYDLESRQAVPVLDTVRRSAENWLATNGGAPPA